MPPSKLICVEKIFQVINKHMFKTTSVLSLGQLLKIKTNFKKYIQQKMKLKKLHVNVKPIHNNFIITTPTHTLKVRTIAMTIDNHMVVIQVQVGKRIIEDIFIDGGSRVNTIMEQL